MPCKDTFFSASQQIATLFLTAAGVRWMMAAMAVLIQLTAVPLSVALELLSIFTLTTSPI